jgi:hypothetical protein
VHLRAGLNVDPRLAGSFFGGGQLLCSSWRVRANQWFLVYMCCCAKIGIEIQAHCFERLCMIQAYWVEHLCMIHVYRCFEYFCMIHVHHIAVLLLLVGEHGSPPIATLTICSHQVRCSHTAPQSTRSIILHLSSSTLRTPYSTYQTPCSTCQAPHTPQMINPRGEHAMVRLLTFRTPRPRCVYPCADWHRRFLGGCSWARGRCHRCMRGRC